MKIEKNANGHWLAMGEGPLRYIVAEAETRAIARQHWADMYARQYAEGEAMTAHSIMVEEGLPEDLG